MDPAVLAATVARGGRCAPNAAAPAPSTDRCGSCSATTRRSSRYDHPNARRAQAPCPFSRVVPCWPGMTTDGGKPTSTHRPPPAPILRCALFYVGRQQASRPPLLEHAYLGEERAAAVIVARGDSEFVLTSVTCGYRGRGPRTLAAIIATSELSAASSS